MASYGYYYGGLYPQNSSLYSAGLRKAIRRRTRNALVNIQAIHNREHDPVGCDNVPLLKPTPNEETKQRLQSITAERKTAEKMVPWRKTAEHQLADKPKQPIRKKRPRLLSTPIQSQATTIQPPPPPPPVRPSAPLPTALLKIDPVDKYVHIHGRNDRCVRHKHGKAPLRTAYQIQDSAATFPLRFSSATELLSPPRPRLDWASPVRSEFEGDSDDLSTSARGGVIGSALRRTLLCTCRGRLCVGS